MGRTCNACGGQDKFIYTLVVQPEEKAHLENSRRRWADDIKIDLKEMDWKGVEWIHLA